MAAKIVAIMPCRNSAWVLGLSARALLMWVDELHILVHACTDNTAQIIAGLHSEFPGRIGDLRIDSGIWQEMAHRQLLLESARAEGATHIVTIDDDEVVTGHLLPKIRQWVEGCSPNAILQLPWLQLKNGIGHVISTGMWAAQNASIAFVDRTELHWAARDGYDHHHRHPMGAMMPYSCPLSPFSRAGGLMHLQMASERRLLAKQALYQANELLRWPQKGAIQIREMYSQTVNAYRLGYTHEVLKPWWEPYAYLMQYLDVDAEPWQEKALRDLVSEHGRDKFAGLDFFGVA